MAGPTTRSATRTRSRWRTSSATSPTPTRLYHKGKTRAGAAGSRFHKHDQESGTALALLLRPPTRRATYRHLSFDAPALLLQASDVDGISIPTKPGRMLILDIHERALFAPAALCPEAASHAGCPLDSTSRTLALPRSNACVPRTWRRSRWRAAAPPTSRLSPDYVLMSARRRIGLTDAWGCVCFLQGDVFIIWSIAVC